MWMRVIIIDNNATACFDQMIEAPNNLACLQHGADPKYIALHAQTQRKLQYHLKHKYGISPEYNSHTIEQPWYGMGQGAGDASNHWVIGTDSMANAYTKKAHGWTIPSPSAQHPIRQDMAAFIDDVNLFIGKPNNVTEEEFLAIIQADINHWHGILRATGGELNTNKCYWSDFHLQFNNKGNPSLRKKTPTGHPTPPYQSWQNSGSSHAHKVQQQFKTPRSSHKHGWKHKSWGTCTIQTMSNLSKSLWTLSTHQMWSWSHIPHHLSPNCNLPFTSHHYDSLNPQQCTIQNNTTNPKQKGLQPKHAQSSHLCPFHSWRTWTETSPYQARAPKNPPSTQTLLSSNHHRQTHWNHTASIPNLGWTIQTNSWRHQNTTVDEQLMDNHPLTVPTNHPRHNPPQQPLDNPQSSTPGLSPNGGFSYRPIHHQRVMNPQQLQTTSASHHLSRNIWSQRHQDPTRSHTPRQYNTITKMNQWIALQLAHTTSSRQISMETMDKNNPNPLCQTWNVNPTENTSQALVSQCNHS